MSLGGMVCTHPTHEGCQLGAEHAGKVWVAALTKQLPYFFMRKACNGHRLQWCSETPQ